MESAANQQFTFRPSVMGRVLRILAFGYALGIVAALVSFLGKGLTVSGFAFGCLRATVVAVPLAFINALVWWFGVPQTLSAIGIGTQTFLGRRLNIPWQEIS